MDAPLQAFNKEYIILCAVLMSLLMKPLQCKTPLHCKCGVYASRFSQAFLLRAALPIIKDSKRQFVQAADTCLDTEGRDPPAPQIHTYSALLKCLHTEDRTERCSGLIPKHYTSMVLNRISVILECLSTADYLAICLIKHTE